VILVDSSVWIDHLRSRDAGLVALLESDEVLTHPWVIGELSLGSIAKRDRFLYLLSRLPCLRLASAESVRALIEERRLYGRGIGWVDAELLASCMRQSSLLWTRDKRLAAIARELGLSAD
jgi:predicted nucleic acid-binding protein